VSWQHWLVGGGGGGGRTPPNPARNGSYVQVSITDMLIL
jgi:hypothetical protein